MLLLCSYDKLGYVHCCRILGRRGIAIMEERIICVGIISISFTYDNFICGVILGIREAIRERRIISGCGVFLFEGISIRFSGFEEIIRIKKRVASIDHFEQSWEAITIIIINHSHSIKSIQTKREQ